MNNHGETVFTVDSVIGGCGVHMLIARHNNPKTINLTTPITFFLFTPI